MGSEMCIRDSAQAEDEIPHDGLSALPRDGFGHPEAVNGGDDESCLLYTSDAADDLLCGDLGGRRIIKKKTQTNTQSHRHPTSR